MKTKRSILLAGSLLAAALPRAAEPAPVAAPAASLVEPVTKAPLVFVKGGCFQMGNIWRENSADNPGTDELPVHEVCVGDFYLGRTEVTQGQWKAIMGTNPSLREDCPTCGTDVCIDDDCPIDHVGYADVQEFLRRLNVKTGADRYRLPTEAEWEYAARSGGKAQRFSGGSDVESVSWYMVTTGYYEDPQVPAPWAHRVATKAPNALGIYDMSGNVYEWTSDWYDPSYYARSPRENPKGPPVGTTCVKRGGCAHGDPWNSRTSRRADSEEQGQPLTGFRLLRVP